MPLGENELTLNSPQRMFSVPGMAHFAYTGPDGTKCGTCSFWMYRKPNGTAVDKRTGEVYDLVKTSSACKKYFELTGKHGPDVSGGTPSCKYFERKI